MRDTRNWIDKAIYYLSPEAGAKRALARLQADSIAQYHARNFEGASLGKRMKGWRAPGTSANAAAVNHDTIRNRVRDQVRNNEYAAKAVQTIENHTIGTGILPSPKSIRKGRSARKAIDEIRFLWEEWGETRDCDADGRLDMYGLQSLTKRHIAQDGEVLVRRRRRQAIDRLPVPVQIQILEVDFLDKSKDGELAGGGFIMGGVEFDAVGRRQFYHLYKSHPGERVLGKSFSLESVRVPAADIEHLFRVDRAGQVRGISFGAPCVVRLRDFSDYQDAQLTRQKLAAAFAGYIQDSEELDPAGVAAAADEFDFIESGTIKRLPNGKTITFPATPTVQDDGHSTRTLQAIAAGWGIPYEMLTGDYSNVNFSSARMARIDFWLNLDKWQYQVMIPGFCTPIWRWFREGAYLMGHTSALEIGADWTPPRRQMLDPTKEIPARVTEIRAGLKSWSAAIRENGEDPATVLAELKADAEALDAHGLILDSDARKTMKAGIAQSYVTAADGSGDSADDSASETSGSGKKQDS